MHTPWRVQPVAPQTEPSRHKCLIFVNEAQKLTRAFAHYPIEGTEVVVSPDVRRRLERLVLHCNLRGEMIQVDVI